MAAPKPKAVEEEPVSLYGDKPVFTYTPKDGGDPIVFPAHATIRGEVDGKTYLEFLWELDENQLSDADQIFAYLRRSHATQDMKRRVLRLPEDEVAVFFRSWAADESSGNTPPPGLPPES
jgi:hypothetical protein